MKEPSRRSPVLRATGHRKNPDLKCYSRPGRSLWMDPPDWFDRDKVPNGSPTRRAIFREFPDSLESSPPPICYLTDESGR